MTGPFSSRNLPNTGSSQNPGFSDGGGSEICPTKVTTASKIADAANIIGFTADGIAITALGAALITAPTGAGPLAAEATAIVAGVTSRVASGVSAVANFADGNIVNGIGGTIGVIGGSSVGFVSRQTVGSFIAKGRKFGDLSASQNRVTRLVGEVADFAFGQGVNQIKCK